METEAWPDETMRVTFLTEGLSTPLPPPEKTQTTHRLPIGTRVVQLSGSLGFLVAHDDHPPMWIPLDGFVPQPAPLDKATDLIESRANTMSGSDVLRFGYFPVQPKEATGHEH